MLVNLYIKNLAVIDEVNLDFTKGFQVLTGETGAGKSILVEAIGLVLGEPAKASLIRDGSTETLVQAVFDVSKRPDVRAWLAENSILSPDNTSELIVKRVISRDVASKILVNDQRVTLKVLQALSQQLIDFTGQHESIELLNSRGDILLLDRFLNPKNSKEKYREVYAQTKIIADKIDALKNAARTKAERLEYLSFVLKEFDDLKITTTAEEENYRRRRELLKNHEQIEKFQYDLTQVLSEGETSVAAGLRGLMAQLARHQSLATVFTTIEPTLKELLIKAEDLSYEAARLGGSGGDYSGVSLDDIEHRLFVLEKLKRKYGVTAEEVVVKKSEFENERDSLKGSDEEIAKLETAFLTLFKNLREVGLVLSQERFAAAKILKEAIAKELKALNMAAVVFEVEINALDATAQKDFKQFSPSGLDRVTFLISPNPGLKPKPLAQIASGGETSRIFLALKQVLSQDKVGVTFIFDEIDTGISGAAVELVGKKLKNLSTDSQVFCVTHHAQIASLADTHYLVKKEMTKTKTITRVNPLKNDDRVEEVARLMGGVKITDKNRAYARELLGKK